MFLTYLFQGLLFPPALLILLLLAGLWSWRRWPRLARTLIGLATLLLIATSNPWLVSELRRAVEWRTPIAAEQLAQAQAIVVLGGGRFVGGAEYGGADQPSFDSLERARYGAYLGRKTGLPLLVSGGSVQGEAEAESVLMARVITDEFQVPVRWREEHSRTTYENAGFGARMLRAQGIERIALVTSALHMPRALEAFEHEGLTVFPAPTDILAARDPHAGWVSELLPRADVQNTFTRVVHELVGRLWYRLRYY